MSMLSIDWFSHLLKFEVDNAEVCLYYPFLPSWKWKLTLLWRKKSIHILVEPISNFHDTRKSTPISRIVIFLLCFEIWRWLHDAKVCLCFCLRWFLTDSAMVNCHQTTMWWICSIFSNRLKQIWVPSESRYILAKPTTEITPIKSYSKDFIGTQNILFWGSVWDY